MICLFDNKETFRFCFSRVLKSFSCAHFLTARLMDSNTVVALLLFILFFFYFSIVNVMPTLLHYLSLSPFLRCFFLVLRRMPLIPGTGFMSLLLMGGGCRMGFGARVRQTGRPAAHIRIPVIPDACVQHRDAQTDTKEWTKHQRWVFFFIYWFS